jgi:tetratricopeptide (TPR) repeat protein/DNA-binding SARP family transcriptional activator
VLIDLLFPDKTERNGLHSLRELVYQLRTAGVPLESDQDGVELPSSAVHADYSAIIKRHRASLEELQVVQGGFLPGYSPNHSEAFTEWYEPYRARVSFALSQVLLHEHVCARNVANLEVSEAAARACLAISPLNERAIRALAETMALGGAKSDAVGLLNEFVAELGIRSPELKLAAEQLKRRIGERLPNPYRAAEELPFAGRDYEMLELRQHLERSQAGVSQAVLIVGDPGIGKTRLVNEFATLSQLESTHVERVTAHPKRHGTPMGVLIELLSALLQLPGAIGISPDSLQSLHRLTNPGASDHDSSRDDEAEAIAQAIAHALHDLIAAVNVETHLTIIVDDGHWVDGISLQLLMDLVEARRHRLLLVVTTRNRQLADDCLWSEETPIINLQVLKHDCAVHLSQRGLRGTSAERDEELQLWMANTAQGNPLYLESLVAHFRATGEKFTVPPGLHELLARRLDNVRADSVTVLQACVVLGALSTEKRLLACLDMRLIDLLSGLNELGRLRLVDTSGDSVLPAHPLIAEVLQKRSPGAVLRLLHRKAATVLEDERDENDSPALLWDSADHWAAAGEPQRALVTLRKCAEHAYRIGRPADAADVFLKAATLQMPDSLRVELLRDAVLAAERAGEFDRVLEGVAAIRRLDSMAVRDEVELAELSALGIVYVDSADYSSRVLSCLHSPAAQPGHRVRVGLAALKYADTYSRPDLAEAIAVAVSESDLAAADELTRLEFLMVRNAALGNPDALAPYARRIQQIAHTVPTALAVGAVLNAGHAFWRAGLLHDAIPALEYAYELAGRSGLVRRQLAASAQLAVILLDARDLEGAQIWRKRSHDIHDANSGQLFEFEFVALQLEFALTEGAVMRAKDLLARADQRRVFSSAIRRRWRRYLAARIGQLSNAPPLAPEELDGFLSDSSDVLSTSGIREAEALIVCVELVRRGRISEARERLRSFLSWRRRHSRAMLPAQLQDVILACGLADVLGESAALLKPATAASRNGYTA